MIRSRGVTAQTCCVFVLSMWLQQQSVLFVPVIYFRKGGAWSGWAAVATMTSWEIFSRFGGR